MMQVNYILTPYFLDEPLPGLMPLAQTDWSINQSSLPAGNKQHRMGVLYQPLADLVADTVKRGQCPVSIAGDCCTAIGVLSGLQRAGLDPLLIWFDAHGDFNTWETTPSGFLGGMPLAMLVGRGEQTVLESLEMVPHSETQVILTDARDLDPGERLAVEGSSLTHLPDVKALLDCPLPDRPLYIHFDTDILRPEDAPAMNYPAPGGPTTGELDQVFQRLADSNQIAGISLSSWNPSMDQSEKSKEACMGLLETLIGAAS
jgi:arginase